MYIIFFPVTLSYGNLLDQPQNLKEGKRGRGGKKVSFISSVCAFSWFELVNWSVPIED